MSSLSTHSSPFRLSIIIPFGTSAERGFIDERILFKSAYLRSLPGVEIIFVEGYSSRPNPDLIEKILADGHTYYHDQEQVKFSQGMCRNLGVANARAPVCLFIDADCHISRQMLERVLAISDVLDIASNTGQFMILPCAYLSESGTNYLYTQPRANWDVLVQNDIISGQNRLTRFFSPASSAMVFNRHKFLELGGNDKSFIGHSYEDFDLMMRYLKASANFACLPKNLEYDSRSWNFTDYRGFRALFAIPGFEALLHGICIYHLYHPEPNNNGYLDNQQINRSKFYHNLTEVKNIRDFPKPLQSGDATDRRVLVFTRENGSCHCSLRGVAPYLGELICRNEDIFFEDECFSPELLARFLVNQDISAILFPNPYGNAKREEIYTYVRENDIPYICYDRGALPDSWFFDINGFNYDSVSYSPEVWDKPLTDAQKRETIAYIADLKSSDSFLEKQGVKINPEELKSSLGLNNKKIIFLPLQVREDSVIRHFTEYPFDYDGFLAIANQVARELVPENYVFLAKKHPLSLDLDKTLYPDLKFVPDNANLGTLLEACDAVLTINSGVGVYAMLHEKPCLVCGNAFYQFDGLNRRIRSGDELEDALRTFDFRFNREKLLRFVHYLITSFYSFGKSTYNEIILPDRIFRAVNYIDFYRINIGGKRYLNAKGVTRKNYLPNSLAYRLFGIDANQITPPKEKANLFSLTDDSRKRILLVCDGENLCAYNAASARLCFLAKELGRTYRLELFCSRSHLAAKNVLAYLGQFYDRIVLDREIKYTSPSLAKQVINDSLFPVNWLEEQAASIFFGFLTHNKAWHAVIYAGVRAAWLAKSAPVHAVKILDISASLNAPFLLVTDKPYAQMLSKRKMLNLFWRFNCVLAGSRKETAWLQPAYPKTIFIEVPATIEKQEHKAHKFHKECQFGIVSSAQDSDNVESIQWFVENVWKQLGQESKLHLYGNICSHIPAPPKNVILHGETDSLEEIYEACTVMINPLIYGRERRTKTVEALAYGKPLLASPAAARGISDPHASGIYLATNRAQFIQGVLLLQGDPALRDELSKNASENAAAKWRPAQVMAPFSAFLEAIGL